MEMPEHSGCDRLVIRLRGSMWTIFSDSRPLFGLGPRPKLDLDVESVWVGWGGV